MTDKSASGLRKHGSSSPLLSPRKYSRGDGPKPPREGRCSRAPDCESPSPPAERRVVMCRFESTPKRSPEGGVEGNSRATAKRRGHHRTHSLNLDLSTSGRKLVLAAVPPRMCVSIKEDYCREKNKEEKTTRDQDPTGSRTQKLLSSSLLFKKAFSEILPFRDKGRRSLGSLTACPEEVENEESQYRHRASRDPKPKSALKKTAPQKSSQSHAGSSSRSRAPVTPARLVERPHRAERCVFLDESDMDIDVGDSPKKDPFVGSEFSNIEAVSTPSRFSQKDLLSPISAQGDRSGTSFSSRSSSSSSVMYLCDLFRSHSTELCPSSPPYQPTPEQNKWREDVHSSSFLSEESFKTGLSHDTSIDCDSFDVSPLKSSQKRPKSFDRPWTLNRTTRIVRSSLKTECVADYDTPKFLEDCFMDTHCHLDFIFAREKHGHSFVDLQKQYATTFPAQFQGCITNYCDPRKLRRLPWQQVLNEDLVWGAFGCHPHFAGYYDSALEEEMMRALRHPKAIAFGEMGLDYSHKCSTPVPVQHAVFEKQLKLAVAVGKPLVIHSRGSDEDVLRIMKKWVPRDYKFHRHCFTDNYEEIEPFLSAFPNMAVGFTAVLTYPSAENARQALTQIPLDRLVVETDAPYFVPRQVSRSVCRFSHPGLALHTIEEIAQLKNLPITYVMAKLRENTQRLYNI